VWTELDGVFAHPPVLRDAAYRARVADVLMRLWGPFVSLTQRYLNCSRWEAEDAWADFIAERFWWLTTKFVVDPAKGATAATYIRSCLLRFCNKRRLSRPMAVVGDFDIKDETPFGNPELMVAGREFVTETLTRLKEPAKTVFYFRYIDDLSIGEIATRMRLSESNVRVLLFRARLLLRRYLVSQAKQEVALK
jgi:RNA polymerase sigma factor (sigma-70 family)